MPKYPILVASYTNDIVTLEFDSDNATLTQTSSITVGHHPSWIAGHPTISNLVYTGLEQSDGKILALKFEDNGKQGRLVSEISSIGQDPCSVYVDKDQVLAANVRPRFISLDPSKKTGYYIVLYVNMIPPKVFFWYCRSDTYPTRRSGCKFIGTWILPSPVWDGSG